MSFLHVFPFSARPQTAAARMPQLDRGLVKERAARLRRKAAERLSLHLEAEQGKVFEVLMEREGMGRTPGFTEIEINGEGSGLRGAILKARATGRTTPSYWRASAIMNDAPKRSVFGRMFGGGRRKPPRSGRSDAAPAALVAEEMREEARDTSKLGVFGR